MAQSHFCGIDFGTSNTAVGYGGETLVLEGGARTIPSALFFNDEDKSVLFGRAAEAAYAEGVDGRFMRSLKRILGTSLMGQSTVVNGKRQSFFDIIAIFLDHIKSQLPPDIERVVMGRPVHFGIDDTDLDARAEDELCRIALSIGFKDVHFQFEPIAAAFAHERRLDRSGLGLVIDIGGGTSDFTLIRLRPKSEQSKDRSADILANSGIRIGGNDFDKALSITSVMGAFGYNTKYGDKSLTVPRAPYHDMSEWSAVNSLYTQDMLRSFQGMHKASFAPERLGRFVKLLERQLGHALLARTEEAKIALSDQGQYVSALSFIEEELAIEHNAQGLAAAIALSMSKIESAMIEALSNAGAEPSDVELVMLTGGSTNLPAFRAMVKTHFPTADISEGDKFGSVAQGLYQDAKRQFA